MLFAPDDNPSRSFIQRCEPGNIVIGGRAYRSSIVVTPDAVEEWRPASLQDLTPADAQRLQEYGPEILLLGTGARQGFADPAFSSPLLERGIGIECMTTAAACRTFNLLLSDDRRVVAALLIDQDANGSVLD